MIYPKDAPGPDPDLYNKFQKKARDIWSALTGTTTNTHARRDLNAAKEEKPKKPKKKKKKALPKDPAEPKGGDDAAEDGADGKNAKDKNTSELPSAKKKTSPTNALNSGMISIAKSDEKTGNPQNR